MRNETSILMLHRVLDDIPTAFELPGCYRIRGTALTPAELIAVVEDAAPILPLAAVEAALAAGEALPPGRVLTFDDGYREHLDVVAPMLAERGAAATFYVATGLHGEGEAVAVVDAWYWLLDHAVRPEVLVPLPKGGVYRGRVDTLEGKAEWVGGVPKQALLAENTAGQQRMIEALADAVECALPDDLAARLYLRPTEWAALVESGMRVGAHSVTHPRLTQLADDDLDREVRQSILDVEAVCSPVAFAYPDGAFDARVVAAVARSGAASAVTCRPGPVKPGGSRLELRRRFVQP